MKKILIISILNCLLLPIFATPDRGVWVIDTLIGLTSNSYIIKQYVRDNMGSHYQNRIQVYIIEKDLKRNQIIKTLKVTEYIETYNSKTEKATRTNRSEDKIEEIIKKNPDLFYSINYAFPIALPNNHNERSQLSNNTITIGNGILKKYKLSEYIILDVPAERIIEEYENEHYRILLIEFGLQYSDSNYYQKIVALER